MNVAFQNGFNKIRIQVKQRRWHRYCLVSNHFWRHVAEEEVVITAVAMTTNQWGIQRVATVPFRFAWEHSIRRYGNTTLYNIKETRVLQLYRYIPNQHTIAFSRINQCLTFCFSKWLHIHSFPFLTVELRQLPFEKEDFERNIIKSLNPLFQ